MKVRSLKQPAGRIKTVALLIVCEASASPWGWKIKFLPLGLQRGPSNHSMGGMVELLAKGAVEKRGI